MCSHHPFPSFLHLLESFRHDVGQRCQTTAVRCFVLRTLSFSHSHSLSRPPCFAASSCVLLSYSTSFVFPFSLLFISLLVPLTLWLLPLSFLPSFPSVSPPLSSHTLHFLLNSNHHPDPTHTPLLHSLIPILMTFLNNNQKKEKK